MAAVSADLQLGNATAELFVPDGAPTPAALARVTHLAIAAHQDDLEIMAYPGIVACFGDEERWFAGVVVSNGAGCPRTGAYAALSEAEMLAIRRREQKKAAFVGGYAAVALLDYPPEENRNPDNPAPTQDLQVLLEATRPQVVYTHNLADKHDAHVAVALRTVAALRALPPGARPERLLGCEVWRDLDWLSDADQVLLDVHAHENLAAALLGLYDSQIDGGKRYDLAALGRRRAHATYNAPLATDATTQLCLAMDLTPLLHDLDQDPADFAQAHIARFAQDVAARLERVRPRPSAKEGDPDGV